MDVTETLAKEIQYGLIPRGLLVGRAFTDYICAKCSETETWKDTGVPGVCTECCRRASKHLLSVPFPTGEGTLVEQVAKEIQEGLVNTGHGAFMAFSKFTCGRCSHTDTWRDSNTPGICFECAKRSAEHLIKQGFLQLSAR